MSTIDIILIILAMLAIVVGLSFSTIYFRRQIVHHIQTHAHPKQARLRWLWVRFWLYAACAAIYSVAEGVMLTRGEDKAPAFAVFWVVFFAWMLIGAIMKIRGYQKEITNHDA
jgi:hypothetical protein